MTSPVPNPGAHEQDRRGVTAVRRGVLYVAAAVGVAAALVLLLLTFVYPVREFYVTDNYLMSNDQVGYITTARWLAETGELRSHVIYPAHLDDPRWRLYMPGIYYVLAAGHLIFGPGPVAWRIPAMLSFVLAAVVVFLIGRRFYGRVEGAVAAGLLVLFPPMAAFAFTALPQLPFIAVSMSAFCVFTYVPDRLRPWLVPVLLVGPFLFRETGALLIIPMGLVVLGQRHRRRWVRLLAVVTTSVLLLFVVLEWQKASGKDSLPVSILGGFNYANAFPPPKPPITIETLWRGLTAAVSANFDDIRRPWAQRYGVTQSLAVILVFALVATVKGTRRDSGGNRDWLALGAGLLAFAAAMLITTLYTWYLYRGLRSMLFAFPLLAVCVAPPLVSAARWLQGRIPLRVSGVALASLAAVGVLLGGAWWSNRHFRPQFATDAGRQMVALVESLGLGEEGVMVAPHGIAKDYALRHYPMRLSFVPRNSRTLRLLAQKHHVQTIIVTTDTRAGNSPRYLKTILDLGLVRTREVPHPSRPDTKLLLFERPRG
jgi:hypothetical protein